MAETKQILLKVDVQGNKELNRLQANFDQNTRALKALRKQQREGKGDSAKLNEQIARSSTTLIANRNALNDQRAAILKNNSALRKNSGFVAGVRKGVGQWAKSMIGLTVAIAAVSRLVGDAVRIIKDFGAANSKLEAITKATTAEMKSMSDQAKQLGSTTKFTASEVTGLQVEFAKLGFPTNDILNMTKATLAGAAALGSDLGEQAALTGALLKQFGLDAREAGRVNDVMAEAASSSALDFSKLSTALPIVGATANAVGVSLERTTALLGTLSDRGLDASTSGTSLRNVFLELSKQGLTWEQAMKKINVAEDKAGEALKLFGKRGATAGLILAETGTSATELEEALIGAEGAAQDMADTMIDNLAGDIDIAKSAWEGFVLSLDEGESVIGNSMRSITQGFTKALTGLKNLDLIWKGTFSGLADFTQGELERTLAGGWETEADVNISKVVAAFDKIPFEKMKGNAAEMQKTWIDILGEDSQEAMVLFNGYMQQRVNIQKELNKETKNGKEIENDGGDGDGGGGGGSKLAEKQIKQAERIAKAKAKVEKKAIEDAQKFKNEKFDEFFESDRERALGAIETEFQDKINAITTNGERETELKKTLAQLQKVALDEQKAIFAEEDAEKEKEALQLKKEVELETEIIEAGDDLVRQGELLEQKRALELANEKLTVEEKTLINAKYNKLQRDNEQALADFKKQQNIEIAQSAANLAGALSGLAKEGSEEAKAFAIVQAGINGALAITQALAQLGPIAGAIAAVGIGVTTGVQIAKISGAQFAEGGVLQGASHKEGGIPFTIDGQAGFEAEGGEAIMTKRAVEMFGHELSAMNQAAGGVSFFKYGGIARKFQQGGSLPTSSGVTSSQQRASIETGMDRFAEDIIQGINDKEVINVSTNTSTVANEVNNIAAEATF